MRKFEQVEPFRDLYEADVDINTKNSLDNSGSNETMQKVLALIVKLWRIIKKKWGSKILRVPKFENSNFCVFHPIEVKFDMGDNIGQRTT